MRGGVGGPPPPLVGSGGPLLPPPARNGIFGGGPTPHLRGKPPAPRGGGAQRDQAPPPPPPPEAPVGGGPHEKPITAIYGKIRQDQLGGDLKQLEHAPLPPSEEHVLRLLHKDDQRIAFLARAMRRRVHPGQAIGRIKIPHIHANFVMVEGTDAAS